MPRPAEPAETGREWEAEEHAPGDTCLPSLSVLMSPDPMVQGRARRRSRDEGRWFLFLEKPFHRVEVKVIQNISRLKKEKMVWT